MRTRTLNFIFAMLTLGAIALTMGSALLLRIAVCMLVMLACAFITAFTAFLTVDVRVRASGRTVQKGDSLNAGVSIRFFSPLPLGQAAFVSDSGQTVRSGGMPFVRYESTVRVDCPHVGAVSPGGGTVFVTDMFNLFVFSRKVPDPGTQILVLPKTYPTDAPKPETRLAGNGEVRLQDDASEPADVREWVEGDPLKRLHWKLTLKSLDPSKLNVKPFVKIYEEAARPDVLVIPDLSQPDTADERAAFLRDGVCESALSVCRAALEEGLPFRLILCEDGIREESAESVQNLQAVAEDLAKARFDAFVPFEVLAAQAMRRVGTAGAAVFVTPSLNPRDAEALSRLKTFCGMTVSVRLVASKGSFQAQMARLEAAGVDVQAYDPWGKGAAV
ncbi:MAG: DUF58 domain-containing protein [Clostridia bacterium]|nr:DUF58 domain-containing protein [Clostridia bacterium]